MRKPKEDFIRNICPRPDNFCDGTAIPDREPKTKDLGVCVYYDVDKGCRHPNYPKKHEHINTQKSAKEQLARIGIGD